MFTAEAKSFNFNEIRWIISNSDQQNYAAFSAGCQWRLVGEIRGEKLHDCDDFNHYSFAKSRTTPALATCSSSQPVLLCYDAAAYRLYRCDLKDVCFIYGTFSYATRDNAYAVVQRRIIITRYGVKKQRRATSVDTFDRNCSGS